jgi:hypothetical protein
MTKVERTVAMAGNPPTLCQCPAMALMGNA